MSTGKSDQTVLWSPDAVGPKHSELLRKPQPNRQPQNMAAGSLRKVNLRFFGGIIPLLQFGLKYMIEKVRRLNQVFGGCCAFRKFQKFHC